MILDRRFTVEFYFLVFEQRYDTFRILSQSSLFSWFSGIEVVLGYNFDQVSLVVVVQGSRSSSSDDVLTDNGIVQQCLQLLWGEIYTLSGNSSRRRTRSIPHFF